MFTHVVLKAIQGPLEGKELILRDGTHWVLGRASDCSLRLPFNDAMASRHHCALGVEAPYVWLWDLGSLNGTFVNGKLIGQRACHQTLEEVQREEHPAVPLFDGDELKVGTNTFEVEFSPHAPCAEGEPRDQQQLWSCECGAGV